MLKNKPSAYVKTGVMLWTYLCFYFDKVNAQPSSKMLSRDSHSYLEGHWCVAQPYSKGDGGRSILRDLHVLVIPK